MDEEYKTFVGVNLPISVVEKVKDFQRRYRIRGKSDAIRQLIELSLYVESKIGLAESISASEMETLREQFENDRLVDYVANMDQKRFSLIVSIMKDEEKIRGQKRLFA